MMKLCATSANLWTASRLHSMTISLEVTLLFTRVAAAQLQLALRKHTFELLTSAGN